MAYLTQLEVHEACTTGDYDSLEEYIATGKYDLDCKDPDWGDRAPIHWACSKGYVDCVRILLENQANGSAKMEQKWTPAHCAAEAGKLNALRCLHTFNVPLHKMDAYGNSPRRVAEIYGHIECAKYLEQIETERKEKKREEGKDDQDEESDEDEDDKIEIFKQKDVKPEKREIRPDTRKRKSKS